MEERRLLVAVALSLVVLTGYSLFFAPSPPPVEPKVAPSAAPATRPTSVAGTTQEKSGATPAPLEASRATVADERERRVEVVAPDYVVAFSNKGARLLSWTLTRHLDAHKKPEEMVATQSAAVRPLDVETGDGRVDELLRTALYRASAEQLEVRAGESALKFEFSDGQVSAEKTIHFRPRGLVTVEVAVRRGVESLPVRLLWGPGIGNPTPEERDVRGYTEPQGVALLGTGGVQKLAPGDLAPGGQSLGAVQWAGVESLYFAALFVPGRRPRAGRDAAAGVAGTR